MLTVVTVGVGCYVAGLAVRGGLDGLLMLPPLTILLFAASGTVDASVWLGLFAGVGRVGASIVTAGFSTHPLFAAVIVLVALEEALSPLTMVGILVLVSGLVIVAVSNGGDRSDWGLADLAFSLSAAAAYALSNVIRRYVLTATSASPPEAVTVNASATPTVLSEYATLTRDRITRPAPASLRAFAVSGLFSAVALLSVFEAFARGSVAVVSDLSGRSPAVTTPVAAVFLADVERMTVGVVIGVGLVVCGATPITVA